jgi:hypothetical protein
MNIIPSFDHNNVIPPHLGDPRKPSDLSPYLCNTLELCQRFSTSKQRISILRGLIEFRNVLNENGILNGFQWLDGSFIENIEISEKRPPNDLDLVTFYLGIPMETQAEICENFPEFANSEVSKQKYKLDHYPVDFGYNPFVTVESTRYWIQLFSHNRLGVWKGMLKLELNTPDIDKQAIEFLNNLAK